MDTDEINHFLPDEIKPETSETGNLQEKLTESILNLLRTNQSQLMSILYRIDVNEKHAKEAFKLLHDDLIAQKLTELIIDKLVQKIEFRKKYSRED